MDGGDGSMTMWAYLVSLTVHFKMVKMVNFMFVYFTTVNQASTEKFCFICINFNLK